MQCAFFFNSNSNLNQIYSFIYFFLAIFYDWSFCDVCLYAGGNFQLIYLLYLFVDWAHIIGQELALVYLIPRGRCWLCSVWIYFSFQCWFTENIFRKMWSRKINYAHTFKILEMAYKSTIGIDLHDFWCCCVFFSFIPSILTKAIQNFGIVVFINKYWKSNSKTV